MVKKADTVEVIEELTAVEFDKLPEGDGGKIDYEEVWTLINGKILTTAGLEKAVNQVRQAAGFQPREFYYSEKKRVFDMWGRKGRKIEKRLAYLGKKKTAVYKFME